MTTRWPRMPLLPVLTAVTAGILVSVFIDVPYLWLAAGCAGLAAMLLLARVRGGAIWSLAAATGIIAGGMAKPAETDTGRLNAQGMRYSARVEQVRCNASSQVITAEVDSAGGRAVRPFRAIIRLQSPLPPVSPGDIIRFSCRWQSPRQAVSPFPGGPDMQGYYFRNRISAVTTIDGEDEISVTGYRPDLRTRMELWRAKVEAAIFDTGIGTDAAEFLVAVFTGERRFLDPVVTENFRNAGLAHVLALSGTHVAIIAFMVSLIFFPLRFRGHRRWQWGLTIATLWVYAIFTGMAPSVTRAVVMATMLLAGKISRRQTDPFNNLCAAALVILIVSPYELFSVGFQLTFLAVCGILMFGCVPDRLRRNWQRTLYGWVAVSVAAVLATAPLAAYYFRQFPTVFLLSNLPMAILLPVFMFSGLGAVMLNLVGLPYGWLVWLADFTYRQSAWLAETLSSLRGASVTVEPMAWWTLIPYYSGLVILWRGLTGRKVMTAVNGTAVCAASLVLMQIVPGREEYPDVVTLRHDYATGVVACEGTTAYLFTDATYGELRSITSYVSRYGEDYFQAKRVRKVVLAKSGLSTRHLKCGDGEWHIYGRCYLLKPGYPDTSVKAKTDYFVLCKRYKGQLKADIERYEPDTVILSTALNPRHAALYADTLRQLKMPYKLLH